MAQPSVEPFVLFVILALRPIGLNRTNKTNGTNFIKLAYLTIL